MEQGSGQQHQQHQDQLRHHHEQHVKSKHAQLAGIPLDLIVRKHQQQHHKNSIMALIGDVELVAATPSQHNWKGIAIALLVIASVIGLVALAVVIMTPPDTGPRIKGQRLELDEITQEALMKPRSLNGSWISASEYLFTDSDGGISIRDFNTNQTRILMSNSSFRQLNSQGFSVSSDLLYVLISSRKVRVHRHSSRAQYALYSVKDSSYIWISLNASGSEPTDSIQQALWSPTGHSVAFVQNNNIYYLPNVSVVDGLKNLVRLTHDGEETVIFNGVADWLYEEEILYGDSAMWFSPDSRRLAYAKFNDSEVGQLTLHTYSSVDQLSPSSGSASWKSSLGTITAPSYPQETILRYPKVGTTNPKVSLHIADLGNVAKDHIVVSPPADIAKSDYYLGSVQWISKDELAVVWLNRVQNMSIITRCEPPNYSCKAINIQRAETQSWVDILDANSLRFSKDGSEMLFLSPVLFSTELGSFPQILRADARPRVESRTAIPAPLALTDGASHVTRILAWDEESKFIYYLGTLPSDRGVRHLFRVSDIEPGSLHPATPECLTCPTEEEKSSRISDRPLSQSTDDGFRQITTNLYTVCEYVSSVQFSPNFDFYSLDCGGPGLPFSAVFSIPDNLRLVVMDSNEELRDILKNRALPRQKTLEVPLPNSEVPARVRLILPPGLREEEEFIFPFVLSVYGGPGSQDVSSRWNIDWDHYLASQKDFVVAHVDARGTGFAGTKFRNAVFHQLGTVEVGDALNVLKHLINSLSYVDERKVAVWGWSYGGYVAAKMLADDIDNVIKCAVAVAPVTKWQLYNTAYTERYMGFPTDERLSFKGHENFEGYNSADLTRHASKFLGRNLMLVHGTGDNNVHFQQTAVLIKALVDKSVLFREQIYPDDSHELSLSRFHLFSSLEAFFREALGPLPDWFSIKCIDEGICYF